MHEARCMRFGAGGSVQEAWCRRLGAGGSVHARYRLGAGSVQAPTNIPDLKCHLTHHMAELYCELYDMDKKVHFLTSNCVLLHSDKNHQMQPKTSLAIK